MATTITKRPATVSFGENIQFARRGSVAYSVQRDKRDADLILRRQSIKYQFPNPTLEADIKDTDVDVRIFKLFFHLSIFIYIYILDINF